MKSINVVELALGCLAFGAIGGFVVGRQLTQAHSVYESGTKAYNHPQPVAAQVPLTQAEIDQRDRTLGVVYPEAGDCYDSDGRLMHNLALAFGGTITACAPGETWKPISERAHVDAHWRAWVEQWEACEKAAVDSHSSKEGFPACEAKAKATRP